MATLLGSAFSLSLAGLATSCVLVLEIGRYEKTPPVLTTLTLLITALGLVGLLS